MRQLLVAIIAALTLAACAPDAIKKASNPGVHDSPHADGGVDVGNMTSAAVPQTQAKLTFPNDWSSSISESVLVIQNGSGSVIQAQKAELKDLSSPTPISLQRYLENKHPGRAYKIISVNGLEGVRADLVKTEAEIQSDIYLISELSDLLHIESRLKSINNGIALGEQILLSVRVEYKGRPYPNPQVKTVTLPPYDRFLHPEYLKASYSLSGDCYAHVESGCYGVTILYGSGGGTKLDVGNGGYDHGRIIELGPETEVPFDSIKVEGKFLVAPRTKIPIADIYTVFTPANHQKEQDSLQLKEGYVYLVRTIGWPEEDMITKIRVDRVEPGKPVTLTYEKLVYVAPETLKKQVELINQYTLKYEMPHSTGEVTLYNRSRWNNYFYASFNFKYATSGNMFITKNSWDLLYSNGAMGAPYFGVPFSSGSFGSVIDVGERDLSDISLADFPKPNFSPLTNPEVKVGHTYLVWHFDDDGEAKYGAVQVLELGPENSWVRLKFKRIRVARAEHFQEWEKRDFPAEIQKVMLRIEKGKSWAYFYPNPENKDEDIMLSAYESSNPRLNVDSRPYKNDRGFYKLPKGTPLENLQANDVESLRGKFSHYVDFEKGDVYAVLLENYFHKVIMVIRIDDYQPGEFLQLSVRYLDRAIVRIRPLITH